MSAREHQHATVREDGPWGYTGPVAREPYTDENPAAHGNIEVIEVCGCGAERCVLVNQVHYEYGPWGEGREQREERLDREARQRRERARHARAQALLRRARPGTLATHLAVYLVDVTEGVMLELRDVDERSLLDDATRIDVIVSDRRTLVSIGDLRQAAADWSDVPGSEAHRVYTAIAEVLP